MNFSWQEMLDMIYALGASEENGMLATRINHGECLILLNSGL